MTKNLLNDGLNLKNKEDRQRNKKWFDTGLDILLKLSKYQLCTDLVANFIFWTSKYQTNHPFYNSESTLKRTMVNMVVEKRKK